MSAPMGPAPKYPIESVDNALKLLQAFTERSTMGVSEAGHLLGVAPSTAHRLLAMLVHWGFLEQRDAREGYVVGPTMLRLARSVLKSADLRGVARPHLADLVSRTNETVHLASLSGKDIVFIDVVEGDHALRSGSRVGQVLPAHCTAAGKAMLSLMSDERVRALFAGTRLRKLTAKSETTLSGLLAELETARKRGYATNLAESEVHLHAIGAPIRSLEGHPLAAVTLAAPAFRLPKGQFSNVADAVIKTADEISAALV